MSLQDDLTPESKASCELPLDSRDKLATLRMLDANINRAAEGLRVVEDYCRFALDDQHLMRRCKHLRHDLTSALKSVDTAALAAAREALLDVGADVSTPQERDRESLLHVAIASWQRIQQALRVIDECLKQIAPSAAPGIEKLRYQAYTLAKACTISADSVQRLAGARLIVLLDGGKSEKSFLRHIRPLIAAGVPMLQLRDKQLSDRRLLARGRTLRQAIDEAASGTLFVVNDRVDIAVLARADGVHIGQDELSVRDARMIVGPQMLIGISTHNIDQARQAVLDGANYIGCGPTFHSSTKQFDNFPGLDYLRQIQAEISLPAFAIGGISAENLPDVRSTGFKRIAVSGAVMAAEDRAAAAHALMAALQDPA